MTEAQKDTIRAIAACRAVLDGRDPKDSASSILVTAEHAIASLLIILMRDPRKASAMLNEGLVPGIEERLSRYNVSKGAGR